MRAFKFMIAGGVAAAALISAAPAAAQYYPGYGYPGYGYGGGNVIGQVLSQVLGGGYGGYGGYNQYGYGYNQQAVVNQCAAAVQQRLSGGYGGYGAYGAYGAYAPYGYNNGYSGYGNARVLGISRVEQRSGGGLTVRGVASSGMNAGYGYNGQGQVDLTWKCKVGSSGRISDIDIDRANLTNNYNYGYGTNGYSPYDYSQYGYRRY